jgi:hypothetical protein
MEPLDLERAVSQRSWELILDLPRRLNVVIEVIDARHAPMLPAGSTPAAAAIRRMLTAHPPPLAAAIDDGLRSTTPIRVALDGFQMVCIRLAAAGVLLLAWEETADDSADEIREDLERIGSWLARAIDARLAQPPHVVDAEHYRMASLGRILSEATTRGSVRRVIGAFVESLGVWDSVRVRVYAAGASGGYFPYVSPVGAAASSAPGELDGATVLRDNRLVRLSRDGIDRLGFASETGDVLMMRLTTGVDIAWLLVFFGTIDGPEQARLSVYADMLRGALTDVLAAAKSRVVATVPQHQLPANDSLATAAQTILEQMTSPIGAPHAALVVTTAAGQRALAVGNTDLLAPFDHRARSDRLLVTSSDAGSVMAIVLGREQPPFASFEREMLKAGVSVLHPWLEVALQRSKASERRSRFREVDTLFDELAAEVVGAGAQASVIVIAVDAAGRRPGLMQTSLGRIRGQLRAGDFAGILSDREIAVLLCDASADQAAVVSARLKQLMEKDDNRGAFLPPVLGMTTRSPESTFSGSLVGAARAAAAGAR